MHTELRLPRNRKEGLLFTLVISIVSVNTIAPIIMGFERGFSLNVYFDTLKVIPIMWIIVLFLVMMVARPLAAKLMMRFSKPTDGFNAKVLFNILFNVLILSIFLTIIGAWVGTQTISLEPIQNFFYAWPRNFFVAFWIELLVAQPIARFVMKSIHLRQIKKLESQKA